MQTYSAEAVWNELDTVTVNVTEPEKVNENAAIYLALYDENGALVKVYKKDNVEETNTFKSDYRASEVRAFVWDDLNPLAK